ncbi:alpha-L-fucosidase [Bacteroidales bacterium OttesenSCG-928-A17]|nr:alpha-L-fucosidase [Bacteroidales bacterium OttesenSCG-928-A17]
MKKIILSLLFICLFLSKTDAQTPNPAHQWFEDARFGMFIHFGPYSALCDGEWVMNNRPYKVEDYLKLQDLFNPQLFNAKEWVDLAKEAGMKYMILTSRHHDSFSNWDTKQSDWNIMNTPYGKDIVKQLTDECHRQGMKIGLYYSLADWTRNDYSHTTGRTGKGSGRTVQGDWNDYIAFMKAQLTELLTNYGDISVIWFDGEWDQMSTEAKSHDESAVDWHYPEIYGLIHSLQPNCMIANNHHLDALPGEDYQIFERDLPGENKTGYSKNAVVAKHVPLEACETINKTWGYRLQDNNYKSVAELVHYLVNAAGYGSNLLLNVGPEPTGKIDKTSSERLKAVGKWLKQYGHTVYGTQGGHIKPQSWGAITKKDKTYYIHVYNNNDGNSLTIPFPEKIKSARWINLDGKLSWKQNNKAKEVTFTLPESLDEIDSIIEVLVK